MPHSTGFGQRRDPRTNRPVALGDVVDELLGEDLFRRGMPVATLTKAWPDVVGERLAEAPRRCPSTAAVLSSGPQTGPGDRRRPTSRRRSASVPTTPWAAVRSRPSGSSSERTKTAGQHPDFVTSDTVRRAPARVA